MVIHVNDVKPTNETKFKEIENPNNARKEGLQHVEEKEDFNVVFVNGQGKQVFYLCQ